MTFKNELTVDEWIKEMGCMYTQQYTYYSDQKKKEILSFVTTWMDLEGVMLHEINKSEKTNAV